MSMVEDVEIIIYGVNGYSKAFCAFYGPSQISAFVDDDPCEDSHFTVQPAKSVLEKPMGTEALVLLAKRRPKMNDGRFINIVPLCLVLVAREQYLYLSRYRLDQLLLNFKQMGGLLKNQISPRTSLEFILVGLGCVGGSLKQWRVWIKALFKSPFLRETYEVLYDVLGCCGLTKSRYLLFRLLARYNGLNDTGYELYIESNGSVMDIYSHSHDQMHVCKWARRVYTLSLAFLNRSQQPYRFLKRWERAWSMEASTAHFKHQWQKMGLKPLPSSGQDILELVQYHAQKTGWVNIDTEMLPQPAPEVARQFSKLLQFPYSEISHPIQCELYPAFMTRYAHLLPGGGI